LTTSENSTESAQTLTTESAAQPSAPTSTTSVAKIKPALLRYRVLAWTTGLWLLLLTGEMIAKYGFGVHTPNWIAVVHGWVYFIYLLVTADLAVKVRWPIPRTVGTLIAGTVPLLSFFVEHVNANKVKRDFNL
jgi:integral membrane protein